jgi:6-phosphogluconolactonase (cycloisomerase 2 family)
LLFLRVAGNQVDVQSLWLDNLSGIDGLDGAFDIELSPDERHLYVAGTDDQRIARFARNLTTGELAFLGTTITGSQPERLAASSDGAHLYVQRPGALETYSRDPVSGDLTLIDTVLDGVAGVQGMHDPASLLLTADGRHLYVGSVADGTLQGAIALFERNATTGLLTFLTHYFGGAPGSTTRQAPDPRALRLSNSGARLLAADGASGSLTTIARDPATGALDLNLVSISPFGLTWSGALVPSNDQRTLYSSSTTTLSTFALTDIFADGFESGDTSRWQN